MDQYSNVVLACELGSGTLTVRPVTPGEVAFELCHGEGHETSVYVTASEAREFAESILIAADRSEA